MTIDPRQFEQQLLGTVSKRRSRPLKRRLIRLGWGMGITAIAVGLAQFLAPLLGFRGTDLLGVIAFSSAADLAAFTLGILYLTIAVAEGASILDAVSLAAMVYCYLRPEDWMFTLGLGLVNAVLYLVQQKAKPAIIFACCFVVANLLRRLM